MGMKECDQVRKRRRRVSRKSEKRYTKPATIGLCIQGIDGILVGGRGSASGGGGKGNAASGKGVVGSASRKSRGNGTTLRQFTIAVELVRGMQVGVGGKSTIALLSVVNPKGISDVQMGCQLTIKVVHSFSCKSRKPDSTDSLEPSRGKTPTLAMVWYTWHTRNWAIFQNEALNLKDILHNETLTQYYPFAGRLISENCIHCNDKGVEYEEAQLECRISAVVDEPDDVALKILLRNVRTRDETKAIVNVLSDQIKKAKMQVEGLKSPDEIEELSNSKEFVNYKEYLCSSCVWVPILQGGFWVGKAR
ncbi:hypothetical protein LguiB_001963 [Lonicera macranthoides]